MKETAIQTAILNYLALLENLGECYVIRNNSFSGYVQRANGSRGWINNSKRGAPDIILLFKGCYIGLEIKNERGKQSPDQRAAQSKIETCGGYYRIIRSVDELIQTLKEISKLVTT